MRIRLPYGKDKTVIVDVPDKNVFFVVDRGIAPSLKNPRDEIRRALRNPIGTPPLQELVGSKDKVVVIGDDITRPTPQSIVVPVLLDELNAVGVPDGNIQVIIALGTHREMSEKEIREKYGSEVVKRVPVVNHDYKDLKKLVDMGQTKTGIPISVNKEVCDADFVIGVGNIVPHCLAGWAGGGKIIQPGVCGEETTALTHVMAGRVRPITKLMGRLDSDVRREIDAVALKAGLKLIVNTVLNREDKISHVVVGDPIQAFREGVKAAERIYCPEVPGLGDIVVVSSYPADIDYYQASKALAYASLAVKQGGTMVLVTPCPEGISPIHPVLKERATLTYSENLEAIEKKEIDDLIAGAVLLVHAQILERAEVICYSHGLTKEDKKALGFKHANTVEEAMEMAFRSQGRDAKVGVLKCGEILPMVK
ncbi:MAG: nickel-dependent lactate racemase [Chloroflexi bacterium]|nr:nickel-dependent lactate racemase [Chloroflexota bacterium]NWF78216.1 nickel-dependent lactate racemase [Chloroflexota bacterium]